MRPIAFCVEQRNLMAPARPRTLLHAPPRPSPPSQVLVVSRPASRSPAAGSDDEHCVGSRKDVLNLQGQCITTNGAGLIKSSLAPQRSRPVLIREILLDGCMFESEEAEKTFLLAILSNTLVERISGTPTKRAKSLKSLWTEVDKHIVSNAERASHDRNRREFGDKVDTYQRWGEEQRERRIDLLNDARDRRDMIRLEERAARDGLSNDIVYATNRQLAAERRQQLRLEKDQQRREFVDTEYSARCALFSNAIGETTHICVLEEVGQRQTIGQDRERSKQIVWMTEREDVFRSKIREHCRLGYAMLHRLRLESHHAAVATIIDQESVAELEALLRQRQRHKQHALWRRRKREEVELFVRAEKVTRDSIEKEEDNFFFTNREKLHRTIEMILAKYASQRESLSLLESNIRDMREGHFTQWFSLAVQRFYIESRVIRVYVTSMKREAHRRALLDVLPTVSIDSIEEQRHIVMFCAATPSHDPPPGVSLFPTGAALRVSLPQEWTAQMQEAQAKCRASMVEEKTAMTESMQVLAEIAKKLVDSRNVAFQLSIDDLHRRLQTSRLGSSNSPTDAELNPDASLGKTARLNNKSMFRKIPAAAVLPSEPITEPNFLRAAPELLRWRCAFADRSGVTSIRNSKERVQKATIELKIVSSDCTDIDNLHRMQLKSSAAHAQYCDGVEQKEPAWEALSMDEDSMFLAPTETHPHLDGSRTIPGIRVETEIDDSPIRFRKKQSVISDATAAPERDGAHHELRVEVDLPRADESPSISGLESLTLNNSIAQPRKSVVVAASQVTDALQSLTYRCLADGTFSQSRQHAIIGVDYVITVGVAIKPCYGDASAEIDPYGYAPLAPRGSPRQISLSLSGRIDVCVVPSFFSACLGEPRLLVEKQMDEVPLLAAPPPLTPPFVARYGQDKKLVLEESTEATAFAGSKCQVEVFTGSLSGAERLSIRDDLPTLRLDVTEKLKTVTRVLINGNAVAEVEGSIQSTKFVTPSNAIEGAKPRFLLRFTKSATLSDIREVLQRMRFHDYEADPWEGRMIVRLAISAPAGGGVSILDAHFDIEHIDKPTELRIAYPKLTFRSPMLSCPPLVKQCASNYFVRLFHQCVVFDEDTDKFSGGFIKVVLTNSVRGDAVALVPDTHMLSPVEESLQVPVLLSMNGDQVIFQGQVVAILTEGRALTTQDFPEDGATTLNLQLADDEQCSIAAVQCMLRHIAFYSSNPPSNAKGHNVSQQRDVSVDVQIMDNEQASKIHEVVSIRGAGHSLQLPEKSSSIEYKEGNPPTRLPNTDLSNDRIKPITTFAGGYILATVADHFDQDIITLRPDETEYRFQENHGGSSPPSRAVSPSPSTRQLAQVAGKIRSALSKEDPAISAVVEAAKARSGVQDIIFNGMTSPLATFQPVQRGVLIQLLRDTKKDVLTRKHVVTLLRNLTFWTPNPRVSNKTLRICFCDDPSHTPSQVLVNVDLESVDDVTEIRMKSPKKRVLLQAAPAVYPLCPFGRCMLYDADTDFFDGGQFTIQCASGAPKGDVFSLVLPSRQREIPVQRLGIPAEGYLTQTYPDLTVSMNTFFLGEKEVGRVEFISRDGGMIEVRLTFASDGTGQLVPTALASYMMNSVCYGNHSDRLKDMSRLFLLRVRDSKNPIDGKLKVPVELAAPTIAFQSDGSQFVSRVNVTPNAGAFVQPGSRIVVQTDPIEPKNMVQVPGGTIEVHGPQRHKVSLSVHQLFFEELQLRRIEDDGRVLLKGGAEVMNLTYPSPGTISFTFGQITHPKPFVTRTVAQSLLRYVTLTVLEPLEVKALSTSAAAQPNGAFLFGVDASVVQSIAPAGEESAMSSSVKGGDATPRAGRMQSRKSITAMPRTRSLSSTVNSFASLAQPAIGPEDDDDVNTLVLRWRLHDGQNLSTLTSYIIPKVLA